MKSTWRVCPAQSEGLLSQFSPEDDPWASYYHPALKDEKTVSVEAWNLPTILCLHMCSWVRIWDSALGSTACQATPSLLLRVGLPPTPPAVWCINKPSAFVALLSSPPGDVLSRKAQAGCFRGETAALAHRPEEAAAFLGLLL